MILIWVSWSGVSWYGRFLTSEVSGPNREVHRRYGSVDKDLKAPSSVI